MLNQQFGMGVYSNAGKFFGGCTTGGLSRSAQLYRVSDITHQDAEYVYVQTLPASTPMPLNCTMTEK
jgi:hypothetical protein